MAPLRGGHAFDTVAKPIWSGLKDRGRFAEYRAMAEECFKWARGGEKGFPNA